MENRLFRSPFCFLVFWIALSCGREEPNQSNSSAQAKATFGTKYQSLLIDDSATAKAYLTSYRKEALRQKDTLNVANANYEWAKVHLSESRPDSAFYYFNDSRQHYEALGDSLQVAEKLILMADIYWKFNDHFGIEGVSHDALRFLGEIDTSYDTIYAGIVYNNYGLASMGLKDYSTAIEMFEKADEFTRDPVGKKLVANNRAWAHMEQEDFLRAIQILRPYSKTNVDNREANAKVLDNLGYAMHKTGLAGGHELMLESKRIREENQNHFGLVPVYVHLSEYYRDQPGLAKQYANKAYQSAAAAQSPDDRLHALQNLRRLSEGDRLERYSAQWIALKDSLENARQASKYQFARIRFDSRKAVEENLRLKADQAEAQLQIKERELQNMILATVIGGILIISFLVYRNIRRRHRDEKAHEVQKTEERISKRLHDELANDVFNAMAFAQSRDLADPEARESLLGSLDSVYSRTRDISRDHAAAEFGEDYSTDLKNMLFGFNTPKMNVLVQGLDNIPWERIRPPGKVATWRILQELMVNNRKHSHATLTGIRFRMERDWVRIEYTDNGHGMDLGVRQRRNGLRNVENRIETIGGTITFESEPTKGLSALVSFPI